jgi:hypothetical protein
VTATIAGGNNTEDVKAINVMTADLRLFAAHYNNQIVGENHLFRTLFCKNPPNKPKILTRTQNFLSVSLSLSLCLLCTLHAHKHHHQRDKHARERERERERREATRAKCGE